MEGITTQWHLRLLLLEKIFIILIKSKDEGKYQEWIQSNTTPDKGNFYPKAIREWDALPESAISSADIEDDCVAKFTSLVRARD